MLHPNKIQKILPRGLPQIAWTNSSRYRRSRLIRAQQMRANGASVIGVWSQNFSIHCNKTNRLCLQYRCSDEISIQVLPLCIKVEILRWCQIIGKLLLVEMQKRISKKSQNLKRRRQLLPLIRIRRPKFTSFWTKWTKKRKGGAIIRFEVK